MAYFIGEKINMQMELGRIETATSSIRNAWNVYASLLLTWVIKHDNLRTEFFYIL
jgi:hypothetical protein